MKLVQLNVWGGRIVFKLPEFISAQHADIVCMQEVNSIEGDTGGVFESLEMLQAKGDFTESFLAPSLSFAYQQRTVRYGNAILSRLPLTDKQIRFFEGAFTPDYDDEALTTGDHARNFQHAVVSVDGKKVHLINAHGTYIEGSKLGNEHTVQHIDALLHYAERFGNEAVIITGDFNLAPESESIQLLSRRYRNLVVEREVLSTYSSVMHTFQVPCDYIFVSDKVTVRSFETIDTVVSDHKALMLEFEV